jgi:hypothetical protein
MRAFQSELPVVFRPHRNEALSSWLTRIAGVYHFDLAALASECLGWKPDEVAEIDLAPSATALDDLSRLTRADSSIVTRCTVHAVFPGWLPDWVTLQAAGLHVNGQTVCLPGVRFHVCMACLGDDLCRGGQFLRLEWLCAAVTICDKHQIALQACEKPLSSLECRQQRNATPFALYSGAPDFYPYFNRNSDSLKALSGFEQQLKAAITGGSCAPTMGGREFVAVAMDLTWALLQKVGNDGTRLAHHLEVTQFPVPPGWRNPIVLHSLSRVDLRFRQAILAIIACLLLPKYFSVLANTSSHLGQPDACARLLRILGPEQAEALMARSGRWPTYFRMRMMRAK